jgi:hypothetical protein
MFDTEARPRREIHRGALNVAARAAVADHSASLGPWRVVSMFMVNT